MFRSSSSTTRRSVGRVLRDRSARFFHKSVQVHVADTGYGGSPCHALAPSDSVRAPAPLVLQSVWPSSCSPCPCPPTRSFVVRATPTCNVAASYETHRRVHVYVVSLLGLYPAFTRRALSLEERGTLRKQPHEVVVLRALSIHPSPALAPARRGGRLSTRGWNTPTNPSSRLAFVLGAWYPPRNHTRQCGVRFTLKGLVRVRRSPHSFWHSCLVVPEPALPVLHGVQCVLTARYRASVTRCSIPKGGFPCFLC